MHIEVATLAGARSPGASVLVIGAGPVGLTIAHELAEGGIDVIVLERGPLSDPPMTNEDFEEIRKRFVFTGEYPSRFLETFGVGGSSRIWIIRTPVGGRHMQMVPLDLSDFSIEPHGLSGWPIPYSEHARYLDRAARYCGLPSWTPLPEEMTWFTMDGLEAIPVRSIPGARFWKEEAEFAEANPRIRLVTDAYVSRLIVAEGGRSISGVRVASRPGEEFTVEADTYILAAGGIQTPRLLLCSADASGKIPGNASDFVGRCFMEHFHYRAGYMAPSDPAEAFNRAHYARIVCDGAVQQAKYLLSKEERRDHDLPNISYSFAENSLKLDEALSQPDHHPLPGMSAFSGERSSRGSFDGPPALGVKRPVYRRAFSRLRRIVDPRPQLLTVYAQAEQYPDPDNRVQLGSECDMFGVPHANVQWKVTDAEIRGLAASRKRVGELLATGGIGRFYSNLDRGWVPRIGIGGHYIGTTRMAASDADGVVDPDCRVFGMENLYVAGSAVFPSGGSANPTFSAIVLAVRLADHLRSRFEKGARRPVEGQSAE